MHELLNTSNLTKKIRNNLKPSKKIRTNQKILNPKQIEFNQIIGIHYILTMYSPLKKLKINNHNEGKTLVQGVMHLVARTLYLMQLNKDEVKVTLFIIWLYISS